MGIRVKGMIGTDVGTGKGVRVALLSREDVRGGGRRDKPREDPRRAILSQGVLYQESWGALKGLGRRQT